MGILAVPDNNVGLTALLVNTYAGQPAGQIQQAASQLSLTGSSSNQTAPLHDLVPICQQLARLSASKSQQLLGADPAQQAQVFEWLTWAATELSLVTDDRLAHINAHLASRTFLATSSSLSLADLVVFGAVHPAVSKLPAAQYDGFCNLLRWFDLLQHTADASKLFTPVHIPLPAFVPPPPPAVTAKTVGAKSTAAASSTGAASSTATSGGEGGKKEGKKDKAAAAAASGDASSKSSGSMAAADGAAAAAAGGKAKEGGKGRKKDAAAAGGGGKAAGGANDEEPRIDMLDIRVGQIVSVQQHPNADALYLEEIDVGEEKPRQVISGLVKFVPKDKMENRRVVVCCNLKPAKMRDVMSYGMVLCASNEDHTQVDPITPPEGVPLGERITFEGYSNTPMEEINPKKKILERLFPDLKTSSDGTPTYKGAAFMTSKGPVTSTLPNGSVA